MPIGSRGGRSISVADRSFGGSRGSRSFDNSRISYLSGYKPSLQSRIYHHRRPGLRKHYSGYRDGWRRYEWVGRSNQGNIIGFLMCAIISISDEETGSSYLPVSNETSSTKQSPLSTVNPFQTTYSSPTKSTTAFNRTSASVNQEPQKATIVSQTEYYDNRSEKPKLLDDLVAKSYDVCPNCGSLTEL